MIRFKFPDVGEGIHEGKVLKWHYEIGDEVEEGETLVVVETDKVNAELPAPEDGVLKEKGFDVGETVEVGEVLAVIDDGSGEDDEDSAEAQTSADEAPEEKEAEGGEEAAASGASVVGDVETSDTVIPTDEETDEETDNEDRPALATPVARKLAKDLGVDIKRIDGSGPAGRVMKADIRAAAETPSRTEEPARAQSAATRPSMPELAAEGTRREPISTLRKTAVKAMDTSNQLIPDTTVMDEFDVTELVRFRTEQKELAKTREVKLTYLPLIIKAVNLVLKQYPVFNASFDHEREEIVYKDYHHIGIAVDTPDGLIVPNIKHADRKSVFDLARDVEDLATRARERKLTLEELRHTTFSITNYGAFGVESGTPVINHPELAILGVGAIKEKPAVVDGQVVPRWMLPLSLTVDHRIIDGGDAGLFMVELKRYLQNPMDLLLS